MILRMKPASAVALLLILVSVWSLTFSETNTRAYPELNRMFGVGATISPTITYSGYIAMKFYGTYHYVTAVPACRNNFIPCLSDDQTVFYIDTDGGMIRLIFYCGLNYCEYPNQIALQDGTFLYAKGTLLIPSAWPAGNFEPNLTFKGDLYVFNYTLT